MSKDQRLYLRDILERINRIEETARQGEATFRQSYMHQDTIIRSFEVIGEIIKRLEPDGWHNSRTSTGLIMQVSVIF